MTSFVAGVGMIPFTKPGANEPYPQMAAKATRQALADAGIGYELVQQAYVGYVYGDSTAGQRARLRGRHDRHPGRQRQQQLLHRLDRAVPGPPGGGQRRRRLRAGARLRADEPGRARRRCSRTGPAPSSASTKPPTSWSATAEIPLALRYFGGAGLAHMQQYGTQLSTFAKIRAKASRHAANNPLAVFRNVVTEEDVLNSPVMWPGVMTRLMACPPTCGAAAAVVCSADFAQRHGLDRSVRIRAQAMTTDRPITFEARDMREVVGFGMAQAAAQQVYEAAGIGPQDIDVVELHDCFAQNELLSYEALGLCPPGGAEKFVCDGDNTYGGKVVTNPSGGLLSKGHPLGATGLAQCTELVQQLRGTADKRQVEGARLALQHNLGLGGACVVTLYERV